LQGSASSQGAAYPAFFRNLIFLQKGQSLSKITSKSECTRRPGKGPRQLQQKTHGDLGADYPGLNGGLTMTAILRACVLGLTLLMIRIPVSSAADQTIILTLGTGSTLMLDKPFKLVLIEDENVVDVHTQNERLVTLEALKPGASNLIFVDEKSIAITNIRVLVRDAGTI
jgi:Flp pilus assembly secretin CpaC